MKQEFSPYFVIYMDLSLGFVTWICLNLNWLLAVTGVMHEADDAYSIRSTWSCYWLDQFLTLALIDPSLSELILSIFYISMDLSTNYFAHFSGCWVSFVCSCHSILECCVTFSGVKLSIRSFVLFHSTQQPYEITSTLDVRASHSLLFTNIQPLKPSFRG